MYVDSSRGCLGSIRFSVRKIMMYWIRSSTNNLSSYFSLIEARISASDKEQPVPFYKKNYMGILIDIKGQKISEMFVLASILPKNPQKMSNFCPSL